MQLETKNSGVAIQDVTSKEYKCTKRSIQQDITVVNIYAPNIEAPKYIKQILTDLKEEIDSNTIIVGDISIPHTSMDRASRQKIKENKSLKHVRLDGLNRYLEKIPSKSNRIHILLKSTYIFPV